MRVGKAVGKWMRGLGIGGVFLGDLVDLFFLLLWLVDVARKCYMPGKPFVPYF